MFYFPKNCDTHMPFVVSSHTMIHLWVSERRTNIPGGSSKMQLSFLSTWNMCVRDSGRNIFMFSSEMNFLLKKGSLSSPCCVRSMSACSFSFAVERPVTSAQGLKQQPVLPFPKQDFYCHTPYRQRTLHYTPNSEYSYAHTCFMTI